jgi:hypothetical protein
MMIILLLSFSDIYFLELKTKEAVKNTLIFNKFFFQKLS